MGKDPDRSKLLRSSIKSVDFDGTLETNIEEDHRRLVRPGQYRSHANSGTIGKGSGGYADLDTLDGLADNYKPYTDPTTRGRAFGHICIDSQAVIGKEDKQPYHRRLQAKQWLWMRRRRCCCGIWCFVLLLLLVHGAILVLQLMKAMSCGDPDGTCFVLKQLEIWDTSTENWPFRLKYEIDWPSHEPITMSERITVKAEVEGEKLAEIELSPWVYTGHTDGFDGDDELIAKGDPHLVLRYGASTLLTESTINVQSDVLLAKVLSAMTNEQPIKIDLDIECYMTWSGFLGIPIKSNPGLSFAYECERLMQADGTHHYSCGETEDSGLEVVPGFDDETESAALNGIAVHYDEHKQVEVEGRMEGTTTIALDLALIIGQSVPGQDHIMRIHLPGLGLAVHAMPPTSTHKAGDGGDAGTFEMGREMVQVWVAPSAMSLVGLFEASVVTYAFPPVSTDQIRDLQGLLKNASQGNDVHVSGRGHMDANVNYSSDTGSFAQTVLNMCRFNLVLRGTDASTTTVTQDEMGDNERDDVDVSVDTVELLGVNGTNMMLRTSVSLHKIPLSHLNIGGWSLPPMGVEIVANVPELGPAPEWDENEKRWKEEVLGQVLILPFRMVAGTKLEQEFMVIVPQIVQAGYWGYADLMGMRVRMVDEGVSLLSSILSGWEVAATTATATDTQFTASSTPTPTTIAATATATTTTTTTNKPDDDRVFVDVSISSTSTRLQTNITGDLTNALRALDIPDMLNATSFIMGSIRAVVADVSKREAGALDKPLADLTVDAATITTDTTLTSNHKLISRLDVRMDHEKAFMDVLKGVADGTDIKIALKDGKITSPGIALQQAALSTAPNDDPFAMFIGNARLDVRPASQVIGVMSVFPFESDHTVSSSDGIKVANDSGYSLDGFALLGGSQQGSPIVLPCLVKSVCPDDIPLPDADPEILFAMNISSTRVSLPSWVRIRLRTPSIWLHARNVHTPMLDFQVLPTEVSTSLEEDIPTEMTVQIKVVMKDLILLQSLMSDKLGTEKVPITIRTASEVSYLERLMTTEIDFTIEPSAAMESIPEEFTESGAKWFLPTKDEGTWKLVQTSSILAGFEIEPPELAMSWPFVQDFILDGLQGSVYFSGKRVGHVAPKAGSVALHQGSNSFTTTASFTGDSQPYALAECPEGTLAGSATDRRLCFLNKVIVDMINEEPIAISVALSFKNYLGTPVAISTDLLLSEDKPLERSYRFENNDDFKFIYDVNIGWQETVWQSLDFWNGLEIDVAVKIRNIFNFDVTFYSLSFSVYFNDPDGVNLWYVPNKYAAATNVFLIDLELPMDPPIVAKAGQKVWSQTYRIKIPPSSYPQIIRLYDEVYLNNRLCAHLRRGLMKFELQAPGSSEPLVFTQPFEANSVGMINPLDCDATDVMTDTCISTVDAKLEFANSQESADELFMATGQPIRVRVRVVGASGMSKVCVVGNIGCAKPEVFLEAQGGCALNVCLTCGQTDTGSCKQSSTRTGTSVTWADQWLDLGNRDPTSPLIIKLLRKSTLGTNINMSEKKINNWNDKSSGQMYTVTEKNVATWQFEVHYEGIDTSSAGKNIRLINGVNTQLSLFSKQKFFVRDTFRIDFSFTIKRTGLMGTQGGEGMVLVIQNEAEGALGNGGCWTQHCHGYEGIGKSVGVVLNNYGTPTAGVYINGVTSDEENLGKATAGVSNIDDNTVHQCVVRYRALERVLRVSVWKGDTPLEPDETIPTPLISALVDMDEIDFGTDGMAWIGFTASSGSQFSNTINIHSFKFGTSKTVALMTTVEEQGHVITIADGVTQGEFHLDARNSCGRPRTSGGDTWEIWLTGVNGGATVTVREENIHDLGEGRYKVILAFLFPGEYMVWVKVNGEPTEHTVGEVRASSTY